MFFFRSGAWGWGQKKNGLQCAKYLQISFGNFFCFTIQWTRQTFTQTNAPILTHTIIPSLSENIPRVQWGGFFFVDEFNF